MHLFQGHLQSRLFIHIVNEITIQNMKVRQKLDKHVVSTFLKENDNCVVYIHYGKQYIQNSHNRKEIGN